MCQYAGAEASKDWCERYAGLGGSDKVPRGSVEGNCKGRGLKGAAVGGRLGEECMVEAVEGSGEGEACVR